jgi:OmpA-OmpF porin, OOP family
MKKLALSAMLSVLCLSAQADGYFGVEYGAARTSLPGTSYPEQSVSEDERAEARKFFIGFDVTPTFALESGYFSMGYVSRTTNVANPWYSSSSTYRSKTSVFFLDAVGRAPVSDHASVFGKIGLAATSTKTRVDHDVYGFDSSTNGTGTRFGFGLEAKLSKTVVARAEFERTARLSSTEPAASALDSLVVGALVKF